MAANFASAYVDEVSLAKRVPARRRLPASQAWRGANPKPLFRNTTTALVSPKTGILAPPTDPVRMP